MEVYVMQCVSNIPLTYRPSQVAPDSSQVILVEVCMHVDFDMPCTDLNFPLIPTGCINVPQGWNDIISSAHAVAGIVCTFYA
jgi:hypothetical protein